MVTQPIVPMGPNDHSVHPQGTVAASPDIMAQQAATAQAGNVQSSGPVWYGPGLTDAQKGQANAVLGAANGFTYDASGNPSGTPPAASPDATPNPVINAGPNSPANSPSPAIPDTTTNSTVSQLAALQGQPTQSNPSYTLPGVPTPANGADQYLQAYQAALGNNQGVTDVQGQLNALQQSQFLSHQGLEGQAIAMPFVTGQEAAVDKNVNQQQQTLTQQLALAQARQQSGIDVSKAALDYYSGKDTQANSMAMAQYDAQLQQAATLEKQNYDAQQQQLQNAYNAGQLTQQELFTAQQNLAKQAYDSQQAQTLTAYQKATLNQPQTLSPGSALVSATGQPLANNPTATTQNTTANPYAVLPNGADTYNKQTGLLGTAANPVDYIPKGATPTGTTATPAAQKAASTYTGSSVVDFLSQAGQPSDFNSRAALAAKLGITNYTGTAAQNTQMLNMLRGSSGGSSSLPYGILTNPSTYNQASAAPSPAPSSSGSFSL